MLIRRWMTQNPDIVGPAETLAQARQKMAKGDFRRLPVVERGQLVGIITDRDLRQHTGQFEHIRVEAAMSKPVITVTPDMLLDQAANLLVKHKVGGLPVVDSGKLVGIITAIDLLRAFAEVLGTTEEGVSRIDLAFSGSGFDLTMIAGLVADSNGELLGMGSYEGEAGRKDQIVYVRVRTEDARRTADMLTNNGFTVVAIHQ
ncbi:MAG: CBS domain-containing protein [Candidatus Binataceae bacterium]